MAIETTANRMLTHRNRQTDRQKRLSEASFAAAAASEARLSVANQTGQQNKSPATIIYLFDRRMVRPAQHVRPTASRPGALKANAGRGKQCGRPIGMILRADDVKCNPKQECRQQFAKEIMFERGASIGAESCNKSPPGRTSAAAPDRIRLETIMLQTCHRIDENGCIGEQPRMLLAAPNETVEWRRNREFIKSKLSGREESTPTEKATEHRD